MTILPGLVTVNQLLFLRAHAQVKKHHGVWICICLWKKYC